MSALARKMIVIAAEVGVICIALLIVAWAFYSIFAAEVRGSRAECERQHPGRSCMILWVPSP